MTSPAREVRTLEAIAKAEPVDPSEAYQLIRRIAREEIEDWAKQNQAVTLALVLPDNVDREVIAAELRRLADLLIKGNP